MLVQNLLGTYFDKHDTILELALCSTRECVMESLPDPSCLGTPVPAIDKTYFQKIQDLFKIKPGYNSTSTSIIYESFLGSQY